MRRFGSVGCALVVLVFTSACNPEPAELLARARAATTKKERVRLYGKYVDALAFRHDEGGEENARTWLNQPMLDDDALEAINAYTPDGCFGESFCGALVEAAKTRAHFCKPVAAKIMDGCGALEGGNPCDLSNSNPSQAPDAGTVQ